MKKIFLMALLATITLVNASDSKYPEDGSNIESRSPLQHQISLLNSESTALEMELEEAKSQITDLMEQINTKRRALKVFKVQNMLLNQINIYYRRKCTIVEIEESPDETLLALSLSALDLKTESHSEGAAAPMLAAGAPEDFADISEHKRLFELKGTLGLKVAQSEEIIKELNAQLGTLLEYIEVLGSTNDSLRHLTTQEEKDRYLPTLVASLGLNINI